MIFSFINDLQQVHIFDRYGRTVFLSDKKPFIWDGKMNGSLLESSTYWYILQLENETKIEGNIILKNK